MIQDSTKSLRRNLLVFEQCHYCVDSSIIDYLILLDLLIDDPKDVEILIEKGILTNRLGNNENASNLFTNLVRQIPISDPKFYYSNLCQQLNDYCSSTWHKNKAMLRQKYANDLASPVEVRYANNLESPIEVRYVKLSWVHLHPSLEFHFLRLK
ncbi:hypothetical protein Ancab_000865 [Ancistrocladus abbreviatus]